MIRLLAKYGADLNVRDEDGQTPLFYGRILEFVVDDDIGTVCFLSCSFE
jgi:hypothetical protein